MNMGNRFDTIYLSECHVHTALPMDGLLHRGPGVRGALIHSVEVPVNIF